MYCFSTILTSCWNDETPRRQGGQAGLSQHIQQKTRAKCGRFKISQWTQVDIRKEVILSALGPLPIPQNIKSQWHEMVPFFLGEFWTLRALTLPSPMKRRKNTEHWQPKPMPSGQQPNRAESDFHFQQMPKLWIPSSLVFLVTYWLYPFPLLTPKGQRNVCPLGSFVMSCCFVRVDA